MWRIDRHTQLIELPIKLVNKGKLLLLMGVVLQNQLFNEPTGINVVDNLVIT